jgi:hypothetical protein
MFNYFAVVRSRLPVTVLEKIGLTRLMPIGNVQRWCLDAPRICSTCSARLKAVGDSGNILPYTEMTFSFHDRYIDAYLGSWFFSFLSSSGYVGLSTIFTVSHVSMI